MIRLRDKVKKMFDELKAKGQFKEEDSLKLAIRIFDTDGRCPTEIRILACDGDMSKKKLAERKAKRGHSISADRVWCIERMAEYFGFLEWEHGLKERRANEKGNIR